MAAKTRRKRKSAPLLFRLLSKHFNTDLANLPIIEHKFELYDRPNLQMAIDEELTGPDCQAELMGVVAPDMFQTPSLARLSREESAKQLQRGPVEYAYVSLPGAKHIACVKCGLYLVHGAGRTMALLLTTPFPAHPPMLHVEIMASDRDWAEKFVGQLKSKSSQGKAYRGHVLSIEEDCAGRVNIQSHSLPAIQRDEVILPEQLMQRIERQTLSFSKHAERLRAARRHIKRGILLHGPPGTGKTLTAMYLLSQMPGRTVLLLTGHGMKSIEAACRMARLLEPTTVVLEDVDLIGVEREHQTVGANALLFELLNQMDGLAEDVDILFILTSNRPDILEPALAARPGRVDQAIEVPPPDADCRRRLFELYSRGLQLEVSNWERLISRTAGVSGAFIRELLRKSCVFAAEEDHATTLTVRDRHLEEAVNELLVVGGPLTKSLLGVSAASTTET
jgi:cell division protease FtsH